METALRLSHCITSCFVLIAAIFCFSTMANSQISEQIITAGDAGAGDQFGYSVATDGDYAVVGAPYHDHGGPDRGAAYVFVRTESGWIQQAELIASDSWNRDHFGTSVSIHGDYVLIGAPLTNQSGSNSGAAYVFKRIGSNWHQEAKLFANDGAKGDQFGFAVSISGNHCLIGMPYDDDVKNSTGSAYVFARTDTVWSLQAKLKASKAIGQATFGWSVSLDGEYAVVGAPDDRQSNTGGGAVYVFKEAETLWNQDAIVKPPRGSDFGSSVAIHGSHLAIGDNDYYFTVGAAYLFEKVGATWQVEAEYSFNGGWCYDYFGQSVAVNDNLFIAGSPGNNYFGQGSGAAFLGKLGEKDSSRLIKVTSGHASINDKCGYSVALGPNHAIIGMPSDDLDNSDEGSALVISPIANLNDAVFLPDRNSHGNIQNPDTLILPRVADTGFPGLDLSVFVARSNSQDGDQTYMNEVTYAFGSKSNDVIATLVGYDLNDSEVEVSFNGSYLGRLEATRPFKWGRAQNILLSQSLVSPTLPNLLLFDNTENPPASSSWGVGQLELRSCELLPVAQPRGNIDGVDRDHADYVSYYFPGISAGRFLSFEPYDIDGNERVNLLLNGAELYRLSTTGERAWGPALSVRLPDSLIHDSEPNLLMFDNTRNPTETWKWGVRRVFIDSDTPLPSTEMQGNIVDDDQSHANDVTYSFLGTPGKFNLLYQVYDVDTEEEVDVILNGAKIHDVAISADMDWSDTRALLITDKLIHDGAVNHLTFRNVMNFSYGKQMYWGVREVSLAQTISLPYAEEVGSRTAHMNAASFVFGGHTGDLLLTFEAFDIDGPSEVQVILSRVKFHNVAITGDNQWSGPRTILLPDSLIQDYNQNVITFDNTRNPPKTWAWGVRNLSIAPALTAAEAIAPLALSKTGDGAANASTALFDGVIFTPRDPDVEDSALEHQVEPLAGSKGEFIVPLSAEQEIDYVLLYPFESQRHYFSYLIEASLDGQNWHTVVDKSKVFSQGVQLDQFPRVSASYLRITGESVMADLDELNVNATSEESYWKAHEAALKQSPRHGLALAEIMLFRQKPQSADEVEGVKLPTSFALSQNYPNPFNPSTTIKVALPKESEIKLAIYSLSGQLVRELKRGVLPAGYHRFTFDASGIASGVYFYRLEAGEFMATRKMILMR